MGRKPPSQVSGSKDGKISTEKPCELISSCQRWRRLSTFVLISTARSNDISPPGSRTPRLSRRGRLEKPRRPENQKGGPGRLQLMVRRLCFRSALPFQPQDRINRRADCNRNYPFT